MRRSERPATACVAVVLSAWCACSNATESLPCTVEIPGYCWTDLGLAGERVEAVAQLGDSYFAGTRNGLFRLQPGHSPWTRVAFAGKYVTSITAIPGSGRLWVTVAPIGADTTGAVAYASDDGGRTWQPRDGGVSAGNGYHGLALSFAYDQVDPTRLFMGLSDQVLRSLDAGATWTYVYGGPADRGVGVNAISLVPGGSPRGWAGGQDGSGIAFVLRSGDRGATWELLRPSLTPDDAVLAVLGDPYDDARCVIGTYGAVRLTTDAGTSWSPLLLTRLPGWVTGLRYAASLLFAVADEAPEPSSTATSALGLYRSSDRGLTWDTLSVPSGIEGGRALAAGPDGTLLIGTRAGVWRIEAR